MVVGMLSDVTLSTITGPSVGLILRQVGGFWRSEGRRPDTEFIAACTSWAATSMSRSSSNWMIMLVCPSALDEVISVIPGMPVKATSSGVATADAMVSGLAPGKVTLT
ncbi:hypothetical protein PPNSA23_46910 [Phyllobacterium phragmitis]|uniref:Uncharacterized protein n=1 Tax=Phyllobacterium phragmitis TaxID=2670329 RepID=A0ABQ0H764_9HYPH